MGSFPQRPTSRRLMSAAAPFPRLLTVGDEPLRTVAQLREDAVALRTRPMIIAFVSLRGPARQINYRGSS